MKFQNLEQIKNEFNIENNSIEEIRQILRLKQKDFHPDITGETNWNEETKSKFLIISDAIEFIDQIKNTTALVPMEQVNELIKIVKDLIPKNEIKTQDQNFSIELERHISERKSFYRAPKITLSIITGALTFIWLFPQTLADHPVLSNWIDLHNPVFVIVWLILLIYTGLFFLLVLRIERREKEFLRWLKTEKSQSAILREFKFRSPNQEIFYTEELYDFIQRFRGFEKYQDPFARVLLLKRRSYIDSEIAEDLTKLIIEKSIKRNIIELLENPNTLSDAFRWKTVPKTA